MRLLRFLRWPAWERQVLLRQVLALPRVRRTLRRDGASRVIARCVACAPAVPAPTAALPTDLATSRRCAELTALAARLAPGRFTCLDQALALADLLHRRGIQARLRVGVRRPHDGLRAHAWVEVGGVALDAVASDYLPFDDLDAAAQAGTWAR